MDPDNWSGASGAGLVALVRFFPLRICRRIWFKTVGGSQRRWRDRQETVSRRRQPRTPFMS